MSNHDHPTPKSGIPPPPLPTFFIPIFTKDKKRGHEFCSIVVAQFIRKCEPCGSYRRILRLGVPENSMNRATTLSDTFSVLA